jgi:hypothetical protein
MNDPKMGDIIGCSDGDIGVVMRTYLDGPELMVEIAWNSCLHRSLTDPWNAEDYETAGDMFHIMSRA